jgi:hypothetical protein
VIDDDDDEDGREEGLTMCLRRWWEEEKSTEAKVNSTVWMSKAKRDFSEHAKPKGNNSSR